MKEHLISLQYDTKAVDVTERGIVTVAVNGIGIEDSQHDISMPGSFTDTLKNDINRMRWFLNHDTRQLLGVPLRGEEKDGNVIMEGQLNLEKQIGRDTLADYKLYHEAGRTLEHSIGVKALARSEEDRRKVMKWQMLEYSTLTSWGANPNTYLVGIKGGNTAEQLKEHVEFIRMAFKQHGYSDERLKQYDMELNLLLKSLNGGLIVKCPCCGQEFDYEQYPEHTFSSEVQDAARQWFALIAQSETQRQAEMLRPEIREQVASIIDGMKSAPIAEITEKSISDALSFVRCPHCWSKVYRNNNILVEDDSIKANQKPEEDDEDEEEEDENKPKKKSTDEPIGNPSFWAVLNNAKQ